MMRNANTLTRILTLVILTCASLSSIAQDSIQAKFRRYRNTAHVEKVYVHTDRQSYVTGETMWFKAFVVDGAFHKHSNVSKVLYVDIIGADNLPVLQHKIAIAAGKGEGALFIPASMSSGNYLLRAYTAWMKNFSEAFFFQKHITVVNSFIQLDPVTQRTTSEFDAQFFPEGGALVSSVMSTVGVKLTDRSGKGIDGHGAVVNQLGDTVARFKTLKFGMGSFELQPQPEFTYRAVVWAGSRPKQTINLPAALPGGYVMHVTELNDQLEVTVNAPALSRQGFGNVDLFIHTRQQVVESRRAQLDQGKTTFTVPLTKIPAGITHLTIFDGSQPVCERLIFRKPVAPLPLKAQTGLGTYQTRSKVNLKLEAFSPSADVSVSVHRLDSLGNDRHVVHIPEYLLLTSDLAGHVESPAYYFSNDPDAKAAADHLMLTQGWRRFKWEAVFQPQPPMEFIPEYNGHLITGFVTDLSGNRAPGILTYLTTPGRITDIYGSRSNNTGKVLFEMRNFSGSQRVVTHVDSLHKMEIVSPFQVPTLPASLPPLHLPPSTEQELVARSVGMQVQNIYFEDRYINLPSDSSAFFGRADETYFLDDYTRFPVMEEVMREYVPGVLVRKQKDGFKFILLDVVNKKPLYEGPMILLDGVPVFEVDKIMSFDPLKVEKLEVVTRRFFHGILTFPGIVSYTTYNGDLGGFQLDKRYTSISYPGLQLQREFYSPKHEYSETAESHLPDQRSLLYWNPSVTPGADGKATLEFFTSDLPGRYAITVEGLAADGTAGSFMGEFVVKE